MSDSILSIERVFESPRQVVFDCWTSTDALRQWHCGTIKDVVMDLQVGGEFMIQFEPEKDDDCPHHTVRGKYLVVDNPARLQYSWKWDDSEMEDSIVTIDFLEQGPEITLMKVTHERLDTQKLRDDHGMGWTACLVGLEEHLAAAKVVE